MSVNRCVFRSLMLVVMLLSAGEIWAQERERVLDRREHEGYEGWMRIVPTHIKAQYAGGMGVMSVGAGWDYGQKCRWETDLMFGLLPKAYADATHMTFTLRQNYIPWSVQISPRLDLEPLTLGAYINVISGERFWVKEPGKYPDEHYYRFTSRMRLHLALGQRLRLRLPSECVLRDVTLYYELSANDLNIISKACNRYVQLSDIVKFSCGVKFQLFDCRRMQK
ncbi:MAG: hypothetical protein J6L01_07120 [Alistipes sp.]|nr:hypothetical protein [Alistipes sp.]